MEELLVKINYLIREKLWCSIRSLCDAVSYPAYPTILSICITSNLSNLKHVCSNNLGAREGCRPSTCILEKLRNFQRR